MIKLSKFPFKTEKVAPKVSDNKSTSLLLQSGLIRQTMAGVYTYTTLWLRILRKIENIVREEMDNYWSYEILMPALSPKENWEKTWRWESIDVMFHLPASDKKEYGLNSTHEEIVTPLMKEFINSYKDLPTCVYQIQDKFRNEKRAKSGLLRWREFLMKDAYSFHSSDEDFVKYYEWMKKVYMKIFERIGLWEDTVIALANGGTFTDKYSHEFQVKLPVWEDEIYICKSCWLGHNKEIVDEEKWFICAGCGSKEYDLEKASEIWNIFPLETKFTKVFDVKYLNENGEEQIPVMWCYGIWISRAMWIVAEKYATENSIDWPENIAPADYYIIVLWDNLEKADQLAKQLEQEWKEVILDDRQGKKFWFGAKIKDAELLWIKNIIILSDKTLEQDSYELIKSGEKEIVKL
jgi:prolyl-tRNA synthetase